MFAVFDEAFCMLISGVIATFHPPLTGGFQGEKSGAVIGEEGGGHADEGLGLVANTQILM